jgi:hypothetical protein
MQSPRPEPSRRLPDSDFRFRASRFRLLPSGFRLPTSKKCLRVPGIHFPESEIRLRESQKASRE